MTNGSFNIDSGSISHLKQERRRCLFANANPLNSWVFKMYVEQKFEKGE